MLHSRWLSLLQQSQGDYFSGRRTNRENRSWCGLPGEDSNKNLWKRDSQRGGLGGRRSMQHQCMMVLCGCMRCLWWWEGRGLSYNRLKSKQKDIQNGSKRIRLQSAFVVRWTVKTFFSLDYAPVTGPPSWTLYNTDNIIGFLSYILAVPLKEPRNTPRYYLALCVCLRRACQTKLRASVCRAARTGSSWASHCLPVWIPTNCSLFMLIYYTFSPLIRSLRCSKYDCVYFLSLSLSLCLLPSSICSHQWLLIKRKKKLLIYPLC